MNIFLKVKRSLSMVVATTLLVTTAMVSMPFLAKEASAATVSYAATQEETGLMALGDLYGTTKTGDLSVFIAQSTTDGKETGAVYLFNSLTKSLTKVAPGNSTTYHKSAIISDNGSFVAYMQSASANPTTNQLYLYNVASGTSQLVGTVYGSLMAALSADGQKLAYFDSKTLSLKVYNTADTTTLDVPLTGTYQHLQNTNVLYNAVMKYRSNGDLYFLARTNSSAPNTTNHILMFNGVETTVVGKTSNATSLLSVSDDGVYILHDNRLMNTATGVDSAGIFMSNAYIYYSTIISNRYVSRNSELYDLQNKRMYSMPAGMLSSDGKKYITKDTVFLNYDGSKYDASSTRVISTGDLAQNGISAPTAIGTVASGVGKTNTRNATAIFYSPLFVNSIQIKYKGTVIYDGVNVTNKYITVYPSGGYIRIDFSKLPTTMLSALEVGVVNDKGITNVPLTYDTKGNTTPLLGLNAPEGSIVRFGNMDWELIGDNLLLSTDTIGSMAMETASTNPRFNPLVTTNLGYFLNNTFYNTFSDSEKAMIDTNTWKIYKSGTSTLDSTVKAKVGLPSISDLAVLGFPVLNGTTFGFNFWLMDYANSSSNATIWVGSTTLMGTASTNSVNTLTAVRPAIKLSPDVHIASGDGTIFSPYEFAGGAVPSVSAPTDIKNTSSAYPFVDLAWTGVTGADSYAIYRDGLKIGTSLTTSYSDKTAKAGVSYKYTVSALSNSVESQPSTALTVVVPDVPLVLATPKDFISFVNAYNHVFLTWGLVDGAESYNIYRNDFLLKNVNTTHYDDITITPETAYQYSVQAVKGSVTSDKTFLTLTTPKETIPYPAHFTVTKTTYQEIGLEWEGVLGATGYEVYRGNTLLTTTTGTSFTDESMTPGTSVIYKVRSVKNGIYSEYSLKEITVPIKPVFGEAPKSVNDLKLVRAYSDRVKLSWSSVTDATYYELYRDNSLMYVGPLSVITDYGTASEDKYAYTVYSANDFGKTKGNVIDVTTPAEAPAIVITPSQPDGSFTITWNFKTVENADTYYVERNPQWSYKLNSDGTYTRRYYNTATGETMDMGTVKAENGLLPFIETGVTPDKQYTYDVTAVKRNSSTGQEDVIGNTIVDVKTPADGSGATVDKGTSPTNPTTPTTPDTGSNTGDSGSKDKDKNNNSTGTTPGTTPGTTSGGGGGTTPSKTEAIVPAPTGSTDTNTHDGKDKASTPVATPAVAFTDVPVTSFAREAITNLVNQGVVKGYPDGTFHPERAVTRAEFAIMISRGLGLTDNRGYDYKFKDFDVNAWYADGLTTALHNGVTKGYTSDLYKPSKTIPRQEAAIMLTNMITSQGQSSISFTDNGKIIGWAQDAVSKAVKSGLMQGYTTGDFKPYGEVTRAEAAVMVDRLMKLRMQ